MKRKYKNTKVPFHYYDGIDIGYIYNNKFYTDNNELFTTFLGFYLTYHYEINNELKEVHDYDSVLWDIISNYDTFKIPKKYEKEYSKRELDTINYSIKCLKKKELNEKYSYRGDVKQKLFASKETKMWINFILEGKQYKDVEFPKIVYSKVYKRDVIAYKGECYITALSALEDAIYASLYFQYNGDGIEDSENHNHQHDFYSVIADLIRDNDNFIIYKFQEQFYSEQEIKFLRSLHDKLLELNFHPYNSFNPEEQKKEYEKYDELKTNKKYIKLFFYNRYWDIKDAIDKNKKLQRYK